MGLRRILTLIFAAAALGAAVAATLLAPAQPRFTTTDEGHRG